MADAVVIPVVDNNYMKHYATLPDDPAHPGYGTRWTYCGKNAGFWESGEALERLRSGVQGFEGTMKELSSLLVVEDNRKIAAFFLQGITILKSKVGDFSNYHNDLCRDCVAKLNEDGTVRR